jgi:hypothetical protein
MHAFHEKSTFYISKIAVVVLTRPIPLLDSEMANRLVMFTI